ncbi:hypothetical protein POM88_044577 [Heracleum sosnowskyi]|uniref:Uncharacterized protein n=1 Tax=Heracleum sosnowskyi TaxID=360622 RepID=A0AAD8H5H4_9APIA|nr:hypothetical protein POM88_044577 [Heracleum sosnowskyi]
MAEELKTKSSVLDMELEPVVPVSNQADGDAAANDIKRKRDDDDELEGEKEILIGRLCVDNSFLKLHSFFQSKMLVDVSSAVVNPLKLFYELFSLHVLRKMINPNSNVIL